MKPNNKFSKILSFIFVVLFVFSLTSCKKKEDNTQSTATETQPNHISYCVDGDFKSKIDFVIPEELNDKCDRRMSSSFSEGYCEITVFIKDTDYDLFTIYCSKDKKYEEYKDKYNYTVLGNDGTYTFVWYEYEYKDVKEEKFAKIIKEFQSDCKNIKSSFKMEK